MPSFVAHGPLVPDELVQDLEDDRVVIFCGAGISLGAGLPDYNGLVRDAYNAMGMSPPSKRDQRWIWPDRLLGDLEARSQPGMVRTAVANVLSKTPKTVELHKAHLLVPGKDQVSPFRAAWKISPKGSLMPLRKKASKSAAPEF